MTTAMMMKVNDNVDPVNPSIVVTSFPPPLVERRMA
jgi:hypothetical protein